ncbi:unnamed protein product [Calypogeia fissa]
MSTSGTSSPSQKGKPYVIDAIIGNGKFLGALSEDGELHRLWWPNIGFPNHINEFVLGVYVEHLSFDISWLNSGQWTHNQFYIPDTNVLVTKSTCNALPIALELADFCLPDADTVVRSLDVTSLTGSALTVRVYVSASFSIAESTRYNCVAFDQKHDALLYWRHEFAFAVGGGRECTGYEAGRQRETLTMKKVAIEEENKPPRDGHQAAASSGIVLNGNEILVGMRGAMSWTIDTSEADTVNLPIYISAGNSIENALAELQASKGIGAPKLKESTVKYWQEFLSPCRPLKTSNEGIKKLFRRSVLTFKLLTDKTSGALIAAPEVDEDFKKCGGYAYCWGRDGAYIATAIDLCGYHDLVSRFYEWAMKVQSADGSWHQRHFTDGHLAPQWGLQVDETGSIIWGMWQHYSHLVHVSSYADAKNFAEKVYGTVHKGAEFLVGFVDPETRLPLASKDLWEERHGQHIYSAGAVAAGLKAAAEFAKLLERNLEAIAWLKAGESIQDGIMVNGWSEERGQFLRTLKLQVDTTQYKEAREKSARTFTLISPKGYDQYFMWVEGVVDVSLLGLSIPFDVVKVDDRRMKLTAEVIRKRLTIPNVGGLQRYENDHYVGGNPWILTTLWMGLYDAKCGSLELAKESLQWAIDHQTRAGLLPEQVDRVTGKTAWVVPLTWSHAMYVHLVVELDNLGAI